MIRSFLIAVLLLSINTCAFAQNGFYKVYPLQDSRSITDLLILDDDNYCFITTHYFHITDGSGNIKVQKELKEGSYSILESVIRDNEKNFWIAAFVSDNGIDSRKVLFKLNAGGQLISTISLNDQRSFETLKLLPSSGNNFFLAFKDRGENGNSAVRVYLMDKNGNKQWDKQVSDTIYNTYQIKAGPSNSAYIYYQHTESREGEMINLTNAGTITTHQVRLDDPVDEDYYTSDFNTTTDGFIFSGGVQKRAGLETDGLIYKTDQNGNNIWTKKINIKSGDAIFTIQPVADGYIGLGSSGTVSNGTFDSDADILLIKFDLTGKQLWRKAFGGSGNDYARFLHVTAQHIIFAGQSSYPSEVASLPALCKTNMNGELPSAIPFQPDAAALTHLTIPGNSYATILAGIAPGPDGAVLSGVNLLSIDEDIYYPFAIRHDKTGKNEWAIQLSASQGILKVFKKIRADEYIAVTEVKDLFSNWYDVYKLNEKGKILWTQKIRASSVKDVVATSDGGMLFTGAADISFINYEVLLVKFDAAGNEQWIKTIGEPGLWETGRKIIETPEHDFLIVGNSQKEYDIISSLYILKIDKNGNKRWSKTFAQGITNDVGFDLIITPDNGYLFSGTSNERPFINKNLLLIKTDKDGNLAWRKTQDIHLMDEGFRVINRAGGGFLIAGTTAEPPAGVMEKYVFVMKTDQEGNREGAIYFGKTARQTMNPNLTVTSSGDTLLVANTQQEYGNEFVFMTKLNNNIPTGNPREPLNGFITLYPNPSTGLSILRITQPVTGSVTVAVYDQAGKKITTINREKTGDPLEISLTIPGLPSGVYYVKVWVNGKGETIRWMVVR
ncbi:MAG: hypothetical protein DI535_16815 [Citrobacter freundii]|nr:MAG: hypothetical protein DI535_16815 [Citrobacter freundii]